MSASNPQDVRVAIVLDPSLPPGLLANTAAAVAIGLGAVIPQLANVLLTDADGRRFAVGSTLPVPILRADRAGLRALFSRATPAPAGAAIVPFPNFARAIHAFQDYRDAIPTRHLEAEDLDGLALAGPGAWVRSMTGSLPLLR